MHCILVYWGFRRRNINAKRRHQKESDSYSPESRQEIQKYFQRMVLMLDFMEDFFPFIQRFLSPIPERLLREQKIQYSTSHD